MRLATRSFLWSVVPFALLLIGSFWTVQAFVMSAVRNGLRATVRDTQSAIARMRDRTAQREGRVLRVVAENSALKSGLQLLLTNAQDPQARRTVEDQLSEIGGELGFDFLLVSDADGPLAAVLREDGNTHPLDLKKAQPPRQGFFTPGAVTYQVTSEPIDQGSENLGTLSVGELFDLSGVPVPAVLLHHGKVVETNSASLRVPEAEALLRGCPQTAECELRLSGELYTSLPMESGPDPAYQIRSLQSVDAATKPVQNAVRAVFLGAGLLALVLAVAVSGLSSRSIVQPIDGLVERLRDSAKTGDLPEFNGTPARIHEIHELGESFNRATAAIREGQERLQHANIEFLEAMANALDARDPYTAGHSRRVSQYACALGQALSVSEAELNVIRVGALLHDIGKIGISDAILQKPGRLTPQENALIQQHPSIGRRILDRVVAFQPYLDVVELHHENWDGTGYPHGLRGEATPLAARVVKLADAYDAMTSDRPYRAGMSHEDTLAVLRKVVGSQFDPAVFEVFCTLPGKAPSSSLDRLAAAIRGSDVEPAQATVSERKS
jgi:putative nucleotidyltransferase with HDIG domain